MRVISLANTENRRAAFFREAAARRGFSVFDVSWLAYLQNPTAFEDVFAHSLVRIESPGENVDVDAFFRDGAHIEHGELRDMAAAHRGFENALDRLHRLSDTRWMNSPAAIRAMFDKLETHQRLERVGVKTAGLMGSVHSYDELIALIENVGRRRVFVKFRWGSSASAVVAFFAGNRGHEAITSVELGDNGIFNSLKIRRYGDVKDLRRLFDFIGREHAIVEPWIPKASIDEHTFDLRIVCIAGEATHAVVRMSKSPLTNLHLGNRRGRCDAVRATVGESLWNHAHVLAARAQSAFPGSVYAGVDVAFDSAAKHAYVLEVNAFGDLLPGVLDAQGRSTYERQVDVLRNHEASSV